MDTATGFAQLKIRWDKDYTLKSAVFLIPLLIGMTFYHIPLCGYLFFVLGFTIFDIIGFNGMNADPYNLMGYRVIQLMMQFALWALVYTTCGLWTWIAVVIAHWWCFCDRLFYVLQKSKLNTGDEQPWLEGWSIFFILSKVGIFAKTNSFNIVSGLGFIFGIILCIWR